MDTTPGQGRSAQDLSARSSLDDPTRRRLYAFVVAAGEAVTRDQPRDYRLAAELFARAADADPTGTVRTALDQAALQWGRDMVADHAEATDVMDHLRRQGFEPHDDDGVIRLRNCPFHQLARDHTELVCGMNLALLTGLTDALGITTRPRLDPAPDRCCVALDTTQG